MSVLTVLRAMIELDGPWLVGDPTGLGDVDTAPLREHDGTPQIPATSVAGSLRDHLRGRPGVDIAGWMGEVRRGEKDRSGTPSRLRILGVRLSGGDRSVVRASTAVDADTGSAGMRSLRREEHVDAKTTLSVYLLHPRPPERLLLDGLTSWRPVIGRRRTHGWGRATVTEVKHTTVDLSRTDQLVTWLSGGGPEQIDQLLANAAALPRQAASEAQDLLRVRFAVPVGLHVGTGELSETSTGDEEGRIKRFADVIRRDGAPSCRPRRGAACCVATRPSCSAV